MVMAIGWADTLQTRCGDSVVPLLRSVSAKNGILVVLIVENKQKRRREEIFPLKRLLKINKIGDKGEPEG
jgi:hypothetical protein